MSGLEAVTSTGDRRASLEALRDRLAGAIDDPDCPARDLAALSRQLVMVMAELDALPVPEGSAVDTLRDELAARRSAASGQ